MKAKPLSIKYPKSRNISLMLRGLWMFFSPVLMKSNYSNDNCKNNCNTKSDVVPHFYSPPLSRIVPTITNIIQKIAPKIILGISNSFETKEPKIIIAKIKFAQLKNALAKFSLRRLVNSINILPPLDNLVKRFYRNLQILYRTLCEDFAVAHINLRKAVPRSGAKISRFYKIKTVPILLTILMLAVVWALTPVHAGIAAEKNDEDKIDLTTEVTNLKSKDINKKLKAIDKLGRTKDKRATDELIKEMKTEKNPHLKAKIIESLSYTRDRNVVSEIITVLKLTENNNVKYAAVISLGTLGGDEAINALRDTYLNENENLDLRLSALEGLSRMRNNKQSIDTLFRATEDISPIVRKVAIGLLWHNYYPQEKEKIMPVLQKMTQDVDIQVKNSAEQMLEMSKPKKQNGNK